MKALHATLIRLTVLALLAAPAAAWVQQDVPPIQEEGDFYILNFSEDLENALTLEDFVKLCQEATGRNFTYTPDTAKALKEHQVLMLGTKRIPKSDFYSFFQIQMVINEFICIEVGPPRIRLIMIQGLAGGPRAGGAAPKQKAIYVAPDDIQEYEDDPATLIHTTLYLPNTEVRQLSTSMRTMFTDQNTQNMIAVGDHSVILTGFGSQVAALAKLLDLVDRESAIPEAPQPVFDVVPLEYAAAEDVGELIDQLIEAQQRTTVSQQGGQRRGGEGISGALLSREIEPKIIVDSRTNSLLIMALPDELPLIKDLIARLDVEVLEPERNFHIYLVQHMNAVDLADVLDEFLSGAESLDNAAGRTGGRVGGSGSSGSTGGSARTSNEVVVVSDENANALLIAANKTRYEEVQELIRQLDRRQDQVLIETALIELTGTDFRDIGVELAFADTQLEGGFGFSGFGLSTLEQQDDGSYLRVPGFPSDGLVGGLLSGDDVNLPFLIAAAQRTDGANVLNVPSVLVNNNHGARVTTLDEQPTTTVTLGTGGAAATQENFQGWESAGITLEISPSISASNYLRLDVSLVVATFVGSGQGNIPPPRVTREIVTSVNVPDGDTMVFGGIITDNATETRRGIPWLSDLPLVGPLFRRDSRTNTTTTLYFFVTPHILRDRDFADLAEISYRKKEEAARHIGKERVQVIDPDFDTEAGRLDESSRRPPSRRGPAGEVTDPESIGLGPNRRAELMRDAREEAEGAGDGEGTPDPLDIENETDQEEQ